MSTPLWEELADAISRLRQAVADFNRAAELYGTILERISGLGPEQTSERFTLDARIEHAYMDHWKAGEAVDFWYTRVKGLKARYDLEERRRAAEFHGIGPRPWQRPAFQRRPVPAPARLLPLRAMWAPAQGAFDRPTAVLT